MNDLKLILDECLDRLNRGETLEDCLASYPQLADELRPMLAAVARTKGSCTFAPDEGAKARARNRFVAARIELSRKPARSLFSRLGYWPVAVATTVAVTVLAVIGYMALRPTTYPYIPTPSPQGNFVFLISDEVNAIGDFENLYVTIDKVGLLLSGADGGWVEFEPEVKQVDLTLLPGDKTQAIWRGNLPVGRYSKVFIYVSDVRGVLKATGQSEDVKVPSQKLQLNLAFDVSADSVTSFTFDLTVIATGNTKHGEKYMLKPQIGESGADARPFETGGPGKGNPHNKT